MRNSSEHRFARTCYGHLAGVLGVAVTEAMIARGLLSSPSDTTFEMTPAGLAWFDLLAVDLSDLKPGKNGLVSVCFDGTERRRHLGGPLATRLLDQMIALQWLEPVGTTRVFRITSTGEQALAEHLGLASLGLKAP